MLPGPYAKVFDAIHIMSPSIDVYSAWDVVREHAKGLKASSFHSETDEQALMDIYAQKAKVVELKAANTKNNFRNY